MRIEGRVDGKPFRANTVIWGSVAFGVFVGTTAMQLINMATGGDGNTDTYDPATLDVVEFSPEEGLDCKGLSPRHTDEVLAAAITCVPVSE